MKIGVFGSGDVGQSLGAGLVRQGHQVMMGSRDSNSEKVQSWVKRTQASAGSLDQAAAFGELLVLATAWMGTETTLRMMNAENLAGKVVIDVTNPLNYPPNALPVLALGHTDSGGEQVQRWLPKSYVVKAFNTVTHSKMAEPKFMGGPADMFICGNQDQAKQTVTGICKSFGWNVIDMGGIEAARQIEALALLYIHHAIRSGNWAYSFKMIKG